jgi:hypothetical protein
MLLEKYTSEEIDKCITKTSKLLSIHKEFVLSELELIYPGINYYITKKSPIFPKEIIDELLLRSNINLLENLCKTDTRSLETCKTKSFWAKKFAYDNLSIIYPRSTLSGWINEYKRVLNATVKIKKELPSVKYYPFYFLEPKISFGKLRIFFPSLRELRVIDQSRMRFGITMYNEYFLLRSGNGDVKIKILADEFKEGLLYLFYKYPKFNIREAKISKS